MKEHRTPSTLFDPSVRRGLSAALLVGAAVSCLAGTAWAHGTIQTPPSRIHQCRFADNPESPTSAACAAAIAANGGNQFIYDWNAVLQSNAAGQHQMVVPDGELCAGGSDTHNGLDLPRDDWLATAIEPEVGGNFEFVYHATAPHATQDMLFYITPQGWDPSQPLTWNDLDFIGEPGQTSDPIDPFCHLTDVTLEPLPGVGDVYRMVCPLPPRTGRHVIYNVWQRGDSPEAFYACVDVLMSSGDQLFADGFESGGLSAWSSTVP